MAVSFIPISSKSTPHFSRPKPPRYGYIAMAIPRPDGNNKTKPQQLSPTAPAFAFNSPGTSTSEASGSDVPPEANQSANSTAPLTSASGLLSPQANEQIFASPISPRGRLQRNGRSAPATPSDEEVLSPLSLEHEPRMNEVARYNRLKESTDEQLKTAYDQSLALQTERDEALDKQRAAETAKASLEKELKNKTSDADNATKDNERLEQELKIKEAEKSAKEKEVSDWKQKFEDMKTLYINAESNRDEVAQQLEKAEEERDHQIALQAGLKEELEKQDAAVVEVGQAVEQQVSAQEQLDKIMRVFREEFKQLSEGVDIEGYLDQFRETVQAGRRLRRDGSQSSFHHGGLVGDGSSSGRKGGFGKRMVSGASLGDELMGHEGSESEEETGDEGSEDEDQGGEQAAAADEDPTLREIDLDYIHLTPPTTNGWTAGEATSNVEDSLFGEIDTGTQTPAAWSSRPTGAGLGLTLGPGINDRTSMAHGLDWGPGDKGVSTEEQIPSVAELADLRAQAAASAQLRINLSNAQDLAATRQTEIEKQFKLAQGYARELKVYRDNDPDLSPSQRDGFGPYRGRLRTQQPPKQEEKKKPVTAERDYGPFSAFSPPPKPKTVYVDREVIKTEYKYKDRIVRRYSVRLPETRAEWLEVMPTWLKVVVVSLLVLFAGLWMQLWRDRAVWFGVNDLGHQDLIKLTGRLQDGSLWWSLAEWVGGDVSLMG